ncbi:MAG: response regulator [Anaerolineales bacterium]|nr:response regulator [Anaerolineales bacterium]
MLGGELSLQSELGQGSRFTVTLTSNEKSHVGHALAAGTAASSQPVRPETASNGVDRAEQRHILIVEDDPRLPAILVRMLNALGVNALGVESAEQALESIAEKVPLGIFLDLGLPKMSGMELLRRLRENASSAQIPVFIMSGSSDTGEAKTLGAMGFIKKPVTREKIAAAIHQMVEAREMSAVKHVLVADANPQNIHLIQDLFVNDQLQISTCTTGATALQLLLEQAFDSVVLGLNLPDMKGQEWMKKACNHLNPPPVIVFTEHELSEEDVFALRECSQSIVSKGLKNERLRDEVLLSLLGTPASNETVTPEELVATKKEIVASRRRRT